ncbi:hypothetical protein [Streptomyces sp. NPDC056512]|uniref:hypothetical protein n=1 Tax=Streptomyces sp. NPDC056512 TaxID=3345846 RepID=UPI0036BA9295
MKEEDDVSGRKRNWSSIRRAGARGLVAAMAMTGTRTVTSGFAPEEPTPPEAIVEKHAPAVFDRLEEHHRQAITELLHWTYGASGGMVFGLLPERVRRFPGAGAAYGLAIWLGFELGIGPMLGIQRAKHREVLWRVVVALDHVLYGVVVAGRLAPEPSIDTDENNGR